jgi:hypothetical protein
MTPLLLIPVEGRAEYRSEIVAAQDVSDKPGARSSHSDLQPARQSQSAAPLDKSRAI